MATVVAIDVPADVSPAVTQGAVAGCRNALGSGRCVDPGAAYGEPDWYATVRSDGDEPGRLRIEFRKRAPSGELVAERVLSFSDRDPDASRWVSAGLVVAGLVAAEDAMQRPVPLVPLSGSELAPAPALPPARRALLWGIDAGMLVGPGLQQGPYRLGGFGRGWVGSRI